MSSISFSTAAVLPTATAAASRSISASTDQSFADSAANAANALRNQQATREVGEGSGDVSDRDADGRLPWQQSRQPDDEASEDKKEEKPTRPEGDRGQRLDCTV